VLWFNLKGTVRLEPLDALLAKRRRDGKRWKIGRDDSRTLITEMIPRSTPV